MVKLKKIFMLCWILKHYAYTVNGVTKCWYCEAVLPDNTELPSGWSRV